MRIFRLHRALRPASDYGGSLVYARRWNPAGTPLLYASTSLSLACLEVLVNLQPGELPDDRVYSAADLPGSPEVGDFRGSLHDTEATRRFGHRWATDIRSVAILVRSIVVPIEFNVLLNPLHPDFGAVEWSQPEPFALDPRLFRGTGS